jgi:predicted transcriptional regulator
MHQVRLLIHHLQRGLSQRMISRELGLSRNTVKLYVSRILGSGKSLNSLQKEDEATLSALVYAQQKPAVEDSRKEDFLSRVSYFHSELKRTGVTKKLLWQEYKTANERGYEYTAPAARPVL